MATTLGTRVWYEAPDHWRVEHYSLRDPDYLTVYVTDGETLWLYNSDGNTFSRQALSEPAQEAVRPPQFGPVAAENLQQYMDDQKDSDSDYWDVVRETEPVRGIDAVQLVQACCDDGNRVHQLIGQKRYWIDPTYNFLLRLEETSPGVGGRTLYDMVEIEYNPGFDDGIFTFDPPEGATEVPPP